MEKEPNQPEKECAQYAHVGDPSAVTHVVWRCAPSVADEAATTDLFLEAMSWRPPQLAQGTVALPETAEGRLGLEPGKGTKKGHIVQ